MSSCAPATPELSAVIPVSVATLLPETVPGVSLYMEVEEQGTYRLYRGAEFPITAADLANLRSRGITKLYVSGDEHLQYQEYLRQNLDSVLDNRSVPVQQR